MRKDESIIAVIEDYHKLAKDQSYCDYAFHVIITNPTPQIVEDEFPRMVDEYGITSVKLYMTYKPLRLLDYQILDVMYSARKLGITTMVHAENADVIDWMTQHLEQKLMTHPYHHGTSRPPIVEAEATVSLFCALLEMTCSHCNRIASFVWRNSWIRRSCSYTYPVGLPRSTSVMHKRGCFLSTAKRVPSTCSFSLIRCERGTSKVMTPLLSSANPLTCLIQARSAYAHLRSGRTSPTRTPCGPGSRTEHSPLFLQITLLPSTTTQTESSAGSKTGTFHMANSVSSRTGCLVSKPVFLFSSPVGSSPGASPHRNSSRSRLQTQLSYTD